MKWYSVLFAGIMALLAVGAGAFGAVCINNMSPTQGLILIGIAFLLIIVTVAIVSSEIRFAKEISVKSFGRTLAESECDCWIDGVNHEHMTLKVCKKAVSVCKGHESIVDIPYGRLTIQDAIRGSDSCGSNLILKDGLMSLDCVVSDVGAFDYVVDALREATGVDVHVSDWSDTE